jgi:hypothetical protein
MDTTAGSPHGTNRKTAIIVGALFLISYFGVFAGYAFLGPVIDAPDYLVKFHPNKTQVIVGVLLEILNGIAVLGIAVLMYPLLKQQSEGLALGYIGLRVLECGMQVAMDMSPLSLLALSQEYIKAGAPDASSFQTLGALYLAERDAAALMLLIFFSSGALLFYYLLYQTKLVPRFISVWGVMGLGMIVTMNILEISNMALGMIFALPIMTNEIFVALWLIARGFNPAAVASGPAFRSSAIAS